MQHTYRSLAALSFAGLAFLTLFHALALREVYPAYPGTFLAYAPVLAGLWAAGIAAAVRGGARLAPVLALGFFAAMGYGFFLLTAGASRTLVSLFFAFALAGQLALGRLFLARAPHRAEEQEPLPRVRLRA